MEADKRPAPPRPDHYKRYLCTRGGCVSEASRYPGQWIRDTDRPTHEAYHAKLEAMLGAAIEGKRWDG